MVNSNLSETSNIDCAIGSRIYFNGGYGTVKYIGLVAPHEGQWLGIDWDENSRGKHDGMSNNIRYFHASSPTSGSFVRPNKIHYGCTFMEAVREKYAPNNTDPFDVIHLGATKKIEFVGMEKISSQQSQLTRLRDVVLDNSLISRADNDLSIIANTLPNAMELHMCHTLLSHWTDIERICRQGIKLGYLNLSLNIFKKLDDTKIQSPLINIRSLILTECRLNWSEANSLSKLFPNLTELGLCKNRITSIESIGFKNLRLLDLEGNQIGNFSNILSLASLKCLEILNLTNTGLTEFELPTKLSDSNDGDVPFPSLKTLYFCNNLLRKWQSINLMNRLPALEHVLVNGNPLLANESSATSRQFVIAKIKNLKMLDRQVIVPQERRGAEIDYLKSYGKQRQQSNLEDFIKEHPRYDELCQIYGAPEDWEMKTTQTGLLKNSIIDLTIEVPDRQILTRKVPSSMTVQKLKALIGRIYSIDIRRLELSYESAARPGVIVPLDNNVRDLNFYSLEAGNKVLVNVL